jgi:hypothetical protein
MLPAAPLAAVGVPGEALRAAVAEEQDQLTRPVQFGPEGPVLIAPAVPAQAADETGHASIAGWASDSSELGYCASFRSNGQTECAFLKPGGSAESINDFDASSGTSDPKKAQQIKDRLATKGYRSRAASWLYAPELQLTWRAAGSLNDGPKAAGILRVGAQLNGETAPILPVYVASIGATSMHPELIAISPNGTYLGVVSHGTAGAGTGFFELRVLAISSLVGQVYNDTGFSHHQASEYSRAAKLFHEAAVADPKSTLASYNYACALARLEHPGTEDALKAAIAVGGDKVRVKAAHDADFAQVKTAPWFAALVR